MKRRPTMFHFVFEGTSAQFEIFRRVMAQKVPDSWLTLDSQNGPHFHCSILPDPLIAFKTGMILSACFKHFESAGLEITFSES